MIKATELRLGNLVAFNWPTGEGATIYCITEILEGGLRGVQPKYQDYPSEYLTVGVEGIPLSPEWLERCGFMKSHLQDIWFTMQMPICFKDGIAAYEKLTARFVHELQNIHALTGTELEIRLP